MIIRRFDLEKDYKTLTDLSTKWSLPSTPKTWIPEDTFVVEQDNIIICSGSLYQLGKSAMFWIEGLITDKDADKNIRKEGLNILINKLFQLGKEQGAEIVMTSTPRESLKDIFLANGFNPTPEKYYHVGRFD
jgi:hypothetical protein